MEKLLLCVGKTQENLKQYGILKNIMPIFMDQNSYQIILKSYHLHFQNHYSLY